MNGIRMNHKKTLRSLMFAAFGAASLLMTGAMLRAEDWPMWGRTPQRNMVSPDKNPPTDWDVSTGKNVLWSAALGSKSYGNPVIANGIVTIGTNNEGHRDPAMTADGGVLMAFDDNTGKSLWQQ